MQKVVSLLAMEILSNVRSKLCKFLVLPQSTSGCPNRNYPFSLAKGIARRGARNKCHLFATVPKEIRRKIRNGSHRLQEPSSPKVSCMGKVDIMKKGKKKKMKTLKYYDDRTGVPSLPKESPTVSYPQEAENERTNEKNKKKHRQLCVSKTIKNVSAKHDCKEDSRGVQEEQQMKPKQPSAPSLREMKSFRSGRGTLSNFDWKVGDVSLNKR